MGATPAGWYPDPSDSLRQRYFNGADWTENYAPYGGSAAAATKPTNSAWLIGLAITAVCVAALCFAFAIFGRDVGAASVDDVIDVCQGAVKKGLKDPDSVKFSDWKAWEVHGTAPSWMPYSAPGGDKMYSASGLVNAKNSFGGYVGRRPYACDALVTKSGDVTARVNDISELPPSP
jgi:hypothetical protein